MLRQETSSTVSSAISAIADQALQLAAAANSANQKGALLHVCTPA